MYYYSYINIKKVKKERAYLYKLSLYIIIYSGNEAPVGNIEKSRTINSAVLVG